MREGRRLTDIILRSCRGKRENCVPGTVEKKSRQQICNNVGLCHNVKAVYRFLEIIYVDD